MKIFIFGIGQYYQNRKQQFFDVAADDEILGFLDNCVDEVTSFDGFYAYSPKIVKDKESDRIVLMSTYYAEIIEQLVELGVPREKILFWEEYRAEKMRGKMRLYVNTPLQKTKSILIVTTDLNYNGGSLAIINAAVVLTKKGYNVCLSAGSCDEKLRLEIMNRGINLLIYPALPYISNFERPFIEKFDIVLVNVFQMIKLACDISQYKPVLWWLHESDCATDSVYGYIRYQFSSYDNISSMKKIKIYAVSNIAKENFERYYPYQVFGILPYGVQDEANPISHDAEHDKFVFAIIGTVCQLKSQLIFLEAAKRLPRKVREMCEFWIIGACGTDSYGKSVKMKILDISQAKIFGVMNRMELKNAFQRISCVVCASMSETMSLTITEGMMHGKMCITTDKTGIAGYIKDGINGFVCKVGDVVSLHDCMERAFDMREDSSDMRMKARKLYEEEFSMERFGERLECAILDTEERYYKDDKLNKLLPQM